MGLNAAPIDRLVPVQDAFSLLGLKQTKGYQEARLGRLRLLRNGRRTYVKASEIERYIASIEAEPTPIAA